jgi:hypothetical protein
VVVGSNPTRSIIWEVLSGIAILIHTTYVIPKVFPARYVLAILKKEVMVLRISDYYSPLYSIRLKFIKGIFYEQLSAVKSFYLSFW